METATAVLLTNVNSTARLARMHKLAFGDLLATARRRKGYSLRDLAERTGLHYSRLSRIEHGTRPAPGLSEIRLLADCLDVEMSELLVSSGTPREVMEHLLWSERIQAAGAGGRDAGGAPDWPGILRKNTYRLPILARDGARCRAALGAETLELFHFAPGGEAVVAIPPEAVLIFRSRPDPTACTLENVFAVRVKKVRRLGQVINLVLAGDGFELNALLSEGSVRRSRLIEGEAVFAAVPAAAIRS